MGWFHLMRMCWHVTDLIHDISSKDMKRRQLDGRYWWKMNLGWTINGQAMEEGGNTHLTLLSSHLLFNFAKFFVGFNT